MIHLIGPYALAAALIGIGTYGVLARRNAVLVLIGVELIINGAALLLVSSATGAGARWTSGPVLTLFVITIAAAEVVIALAVILAAHRRTGQIDLTTPELEPEPDPEPNSQPAPGSASAQGVS